MTQTLYIAAFSNATTASLANKKQNKDMRRLGCSKDKEEQSLYLESGNTNDAVLYCGNTGAPETHNVLPPL